MAVEDEVRDGSVSSLTYKSLESTHSEDNSASAEDVAWADSCLIKDLEISESKWDSLKDALLEILSSQPEELGSSAPKNDTSLGETDYMITHSSVEPERANDIIQMDRGEIEMINEIPVDNGADSTPSRTYLNSPFLPNFKDELRVSETSDPALDFEFPVNEMESSSENIFMVWDLDIPAEEDLFGGKLKAFDNGLQSTPSTLNGSEAWTQMNDEPLNGLIAGMADLSLSQDAA